jgi:TonB family protein
MERLYVLGAESFVCTNSFARGKSIQQQNLEETSPVLPCRKRLQEPIDLVVVTEEKRKAGGLSLSTFVSLILHVALILWFRSSYRPAESAINDAPIPRYIELMKQNPQEFVEAPGPAIDKTPLRAPLSDRNRKASMPEPTGPNPTTRPGDGGGLYNPPTNPAPRGPQPSAPAFAQAPQQQLQQPSAAQTQPQPITTTSNDTFIYREPAKANAAAGLVNLREAIQRVGRQGSQGGGDGTDLGPLTGGEQGTAEQGPLSFETAWYDWGDYAASMVSKIRVNWYANMPQIIRSGMKGVVTIRFTIHRDGRITDIQTLKSSTVPPYDQAARKAIELSSPLKALPADFPNSSERVTCMFYYNMELPKD